MTKKKTEQEATIEEPKAGPALDWTVLDDEGVHDILELAARKVAEAHSAVTEADDLYQEGTIWLASNAEDVRSYMRDEFFGARNLYKRLSQRLINTVRTDSARSALSIPFHDYSEQAKSDDE